MSLIADALKKADTSSGTLQGSPPPSTKSLWLHRAVLIGSVGIVLAGVALVTRRPAPAARTPGHPAVAESVPAKSSGMQLLRMAQGGLGLSGTIHGGQGESLALIDNQIVQKGDQVQGMRVVQVNSDSVELQDQDGKTKTLGLKD